MNKKFAFIILFMFFVFNSVFAEKVVVDYWIIHPHGGIAYPLGDMANYVNMGFDFGLSVRKGFDAEMSIGGGISFINMAYKNKDAPSPFSSTLIDVEVVYAPYLPDFFIWPYAKFALGLFMTNYVKTDPTGTPGEYVSNSANDNAFGIILGGGLNYPISNLFAANIEILYNQVSLQGGQGENYQFFTFNAGLVVSVK
ncbi:MAG TPA: outer membrane beta-barrel protein [Candidatus Goldiibacteriota bacterium]|nr:outer membrane beta-barrel protein [Candidatus Goldiibacteriota bacterium]